MAEGIARKLIHETYPDCGIEVSSAGLNTFNGSPASQNAIDVCREIGVDLMFHRSQRLNAEIAEGKEEEVAIRLSTAPAATQLPKLSPD